MKRFTTNSLLEYKTRNQKITVLTAYDYSTAKLFDEEGIDVILVGDSLGMVMLGYENTLKVTMNDMIHHTQAVSRGVKRAMVLTDLPFLSYHISVEESIRNAGRLIQEGGAHAVKLEGGSHVLPQIKGIISAQIPVIGHLGLTPQSIHALGGYKVQGKTDEKAKKIIEDAYQLQDAGVSAIVLECVPIHLTEVITENLDIPTIGIGAGPTCDGQVLVYQDMLNLYGNSQPKFVKLFADTGSTMRSGVRQYIEEVSNGTFPDEEHSFCLKENVTKKNSN